MKKGCDIVTTETQLNSCLFPPHFSVQLIGYPQLNKSASALHPHLKVGRLDLGGGCRSKVLAAVTSLAEEVESESDEREPSGL